MRITKFSVCLAMVLVVALSGGNQLQAQQEQGTAAISIAVVDVQKAFQSMDERGQIEARITSQAESLQQEDQDRRSTIEALRSDLAILNEGSDTYKQTRMELERKAIEYQAWKQFQQKKLEAEKAIQMQALYNKLTDAVGEIASQNGYDLVLQKDDTYNIDNRDQQQLTALILQRKVLYADPSIDITDQVIQLANNQYNHGDAQASNGTN